MVNEVTSQPVDQSTQGGRLCGHRHLKMLYHLVLNMSRIHMDRACRLICRLVSG